jgi:hypothetical protein
MVSYSDPNPVGIDSIEPNICLAAARITFMFALTKNFANGEYIK